MVLCCVTHSLYYCFILLIFTFLSFIYVVVFTLLLTAAQYSKVCSYHVLTIHISSDFHPDCFQFSVVTNNAMMNILIFLLAQNFARISLGYIPRNRIAGFILNLSESCQMLCQVNTWTTLSPAVTPSFLPTLDIIQLSNTLNLMCVILQLTVLI